jgi:predicted metal-dependent peptidase
MLSKMVAARTGLLLSEPFFGALALGLKLQEDTTCQTAWVDGRTMGYNPSFIAGLTHEQTISLIAHEVMHCANGHPWRRDGRDMKRFNVACDKAINTTLKDAGFTLPEGALFAEGPEVGQSAEWIYARLPEDQDGKGKDGQGKGDSQGEVRDAPKDADAEGQEPPSEAEWQQATKQAAMAAKAQGKLPASLARLAEEIGQTRVDWRSALRRFVQERAKADYAWSRPNSRFLSLGLYLPSLESHELGELAIAVDTSGSVDDVALATAKAEVMAVIDECQPAAVNVYYADAKVAQHDRFERGDEIVWRPKGGGGTDFRPVFKACEELEVPPVCLIYITDLAGQFPESSEIPTIWVTDTAHVAPIGETVRM